MPPPHKLPLPPFPPFLLSLVLLITSSFLLIPSPVSAILDPSDFLALQSIRASLWDLPGGSFFSGWDFTADPCAFPGVLCLSDRVVVLSLGDPRAGTPGLAGRLSPAVGRLTSLAELSLVPGRVVGPFPKTLASLIELRFLALSRNYLSGPIPSTLFSSLRKLQTVDLSSNLISGHIPTSLTSLPQLSTLLLSHNRFSGAIPPFFHSSSLLRLDLRRNLLSGRVPRLPSSLNYLSLASNRLSGGVSSFLPSLPHLNYLDLSDNSFSGSIPPSIFSFPISSLLLQRNAFSGPVRPDGKVVIDTVDLSHNRLSGMVSPLLASVRRLYLNDNRFSGQVPSGFVERLLGAGIQVLYLQHNFLTGIAIAPEAEIPSSSSVCVQFNCMVPPPQASCPSRAGRQKARPPSQCKGVWKKKKNDTVVAKNGSLMG